MRYVSAERLDAEVRRYVHTEQIDTIFRLVFD
jgi:hypothetical protein